MTGIRTALSLGRRKHYWNGFIAETRKGFKMAKFIRVTKDNRTKDRGIIAVDAICAAFENQDNHNTEIMTIDGFWYEVVDGIEKVYSDVIGEASSSGKEDEPEGRRTKRIMSPAVSEDNMRKNHEATREEKRSSFVYPKKGYGFKRTIKGKSVRVDNFSSGEEKEQNRLRTKAADSTTHETEGT